MSKKEFILFVSQNIDECDLETRRAVLQYIHNSAIPIQEKGVGSQVKFSHLRVDICDISRSSSTRICLRLSNDLPRVGFNFLEHTRIYFAICR